jgi:hypothetical protein
MSSTIGNSATIAAPAHQTSRIHGCRNLVCQEAIGLIVSACLDVKCNYEWCTMGTVYLIHLNSIPGSSSCTHHELFQCLSRPVDTATSGCIYNAVCMPSRRSCVSFICFVNVIIVPSDIPAPSSFASRRTVLWLILCMLLRLSVYGSTALFWYVATFLVSWSFTQSVGLLGRGIGQSQGRYLHTGQHKHRINAHNTDIHALSGIRNHDSSVRADEDSSCVRPHGNCDRHVVTSVPVKWLFLN